MGRKLNTKGTRIYQCINCSHIFISDEEICPLCDCKYMKVYSVSDLIIASNNMMQLLKDKKYKRKGDKEKTVYEIKYVSNDSISYRAKNKLSGGCTDVGIFRRNYE